MRNECVEVIAGKEEFPVFHIRTKHTSYIFSVLACGQLEHQYYGSRIELKQGYPALHEKQEFLGGNLITYTKDHQAIGLENRCLEISTFGKGDIRESFVSITHEDGNRTSDFCYESYQLETSFEGLKTLPFAYDEKKQDTYLRIKLYDTQEKVSLYLTYRVFYDCDVLVKSAKLVNEGKNEIVVNRLLSNQIDFDTNDYILSTFHGGWAREMNRTDHMLLGGKVVAGTCAGVSSNRSNPFVMIREKEATENSLGCYGFNLIYSGNHYEAAEVNSFGKLRFVQGIHPEGFGYHLKPKESLEAPEAVLTYSMEGMQGMSLQMHSFVREHIVRGEWKRKERPILLNSWEAAYFDISENNLVNMAKKAKDAGIELFVVDDGWFGERNDDTSSLGDWVENKKKLPNGLKGLGEKIHALGLMFGIWVEPEMVNENSDCYRNHPDWAVKIPGKPHAVGRNQMILDLTKKEVRDYVIEEMTRVFESTNLEYVKWDMNRIFSDTYSMGLNAVQQIEFSHRYVMGLYEVMECLTKRFPHILFEGCASGGNRFDLGMLCYMPQIWASDNTDAICRAKIQTGYSYGYPMSAITAHVSGCPNHQTLRTTPIETRFQVACFGILGYECNLAELSNEEYLAVKNQIAFYKQHRNTLQFGDYYRIKNGEDSDYVRGLYQWMCVSADRSTALGLMLQGQVIPNMFYAKFKTKGLAQDKCYHFYNRKLSFNIKEFGDLINTVSPIHIKKDSFVHNMVAKFKRMEGETEEYTAEGSLLNHAGVKLKQGFCGMGYDNEVRLFQDYYSRLYVMEEVSCLDSFNNSL